MELTTSLQIECLIRLVIAGLCGAIIGYERQSQMKTAGVRTHLVVSMAAALMMIISKYGFIDGYDAGMRVDPSRFAAGAVTAIGFLGAGIIFVRKQGVSGLTTAAGIWATVGVGMAIGAGMYLIGIVAALLLVAVHFILHRKSRFLKETLIEQVTLHISKDEDVDEILLNVFSTRHIEVINMKIKKLDENNIALRVLVKYPETYQAKDIAQLLREVPNIQSIEM